jgi:hypothetical protein
MEAFYDNSANNLNNPNTPPKTVWFGPRTVDEMCGCRLQVVVDQPQRDDRTLTKDLARLNRERRLEFLEWKKKKPRR